MKYVQASRHEVQGPKTSLGVEIKVCLGSERTLTDEERSLLARCSEDLLKQIMLTNYMNDPEDVKQGREMIKNLTACFPVVSCYIEEIPNGYTPGDPCVVNRPWLVVTTHKGRIVIGWRKRVIQIDWEQSKIKETADELFPGENVTKLGKSIHAWNYDRAKEYLAVLLKDA